MIRIGLAQINATVGDIPGNEAKILRYISEAQRAGVDIVAFPEMALTGYPPEDLLFKSGFIEANLNALARIAKKTRDIVAVTGFIDRKDDLYNSAAVIAGGKVRAIYHKRFLPNYSVFDEERYFKAGQGNLICKSGSLTFGINICEDIWHPAGPMAEQVSAGSQLIINISASPYQYGKVKYKERMLAGRTADYAVFLAYVNLVGGQDELVFDGQSVVFDPEGKLIARAKSFSEDLLIVDIEPDRLLKRRVREPRLRKGMPSRNAVPVIALPEKRTKSHFPKPKPGIEKHLPKAAEVYRALLTGTKDYVEKNGFKKVIIGLSGGIDSALTATIAVDCLGKERVVGLFMPGRYSAEISGNDSRQLAKNLGIGVHVIPIEEVFESYLKTLKKPFANAKPDITEENLQARIRGNFIMAFSNKYGYLVLTTGNKSEIATGYCTLYGDMAGGFAVIKDIPKTLVYSLAEYRNKISPVIPNRILTRPPTAELRPDQKDSDTLPEYPVLDPILKAYVEENLSPGEIIKKGHPENLVRKVIRMVDRNEYKRRQAPPGIRITGRAFGKDWRLPITNAFRQ
ncbi:MAG: NAD+ synthase [Candidatus Omnitrophota bacterium]